MRSNVYFVLVVVSLFLMNIVYQTFAREASENKPIVAVLSLLLRSDGGNGGGVIIPTITGKFIDEAVQGIYYNCSSGRIGVTNANGEYLCDVGDDVVFSIGQVTIGTIAAQAGFFTPYSLFPNDADAAINLARLLQSVDSDGNPNNGVIALSRAQMGQLPPGTDFTDPNFESDVEAALGITLISSQVAQNHLDDAILSNGGTPPPSGGHIPVANAGLDQSVIVYDTIVLDGTSSHDEDGDLLTYLWTFSSVPSGSVIASLVNTLTATPSLTPDVVGNYVVQLVVNDGALNSSADTVTITATAGSGGNTPPPLAWLKEEITHGSGNAAGGIAFDADDNLYMACGSNVDFNGQPNMGYSDILVVKYNNDGDMQWSRLTGSTGSDSVDGIVVDKDQDVLFVTGRTTSSLHGQTAAGGSDIFVIKYDLNGNRLWTIMDGTIRNDTPFDIVIDSVGDVYLTGFTEGVFANYSFSNWTPDIFVTKYNGTDGSKIWTRQVHESNYEKSWAIALDLDDNVYITGYTSSDEFNGQINNGGADVFISKYNSNGGYQWTRLLGTALSDHGKGITTDPHGNVYVLGESTGDLGGEINQGGWDGFIAKYNRYGALIWTRLTGTPQGDYDSDIIVDSSENIYIAGSTDETTPQGDDWDYTVSKFDTAGNRIWIIRNGTSQFDRAKRIAFDSAENIFIHGDTYGTFPDSDPAAGNEIFSAKYGSNVPTGGPYSVGGEVTASPCGFTLTNNGADDLSLNDIGSFTFHTRHPDGSSYNVKVKPGSDQGCTCTVTNGSGSINGTDVTDIEVSCVGA